MTHVTATASGGYYNYGVRNDASSPTMTDLTATASGGIFNYGVGNATASPTMTNVTVTASGGVFDIRRVQLQILVDDPEQHDCRHGGWIQIRHLQRR